MIKGNALVGQSGGPTAVINASLAGVIEGCRQSEGIVSLKGMRFGIDGYFRKGQIVELDDLNSAQLERLKQTPSSALGSSRYKLKDEDLPGIIECFERDNIRYFFLIGGNDTMDTINRINTYADSVGYELTANGIPKTVDNDLFGTDHTPGFRSAARFNYLSALQGGRLAADMKFVDKFVIYQTIGRDAGWLAAAAGMASLQAPGAPHLIYFPERAFSRDDFLRDAIRSIEENGFVSIVVSEGVRYADGSPVSASASVDNFSNTEYGAMGGASAAFSLHKMLREETGYRGEFQIGESLVMCAADRGDLRDFEEAIQCGREAVRLAREGISGYMTTLERKEDKGEIYFEMGKIPLHDVAVRARAMPDDFINEAGNHITDKAVNYLKPLIQTIDNYFEF